MQMLKRWPRNSRSTLRNSAGNSWRHGRRAGHPASAGREECDRFVRSGDEFPDHHGASQDHARAHRGRGQVGYPPRTGPGGGRHCRSERGQDIRSGGELGGVVQWIEWNSDSGGCVHRADRRPLHSPMSPVLSRALRTDVQLGQLPDRHDAPRSGKYRPTASISAQCCVP